MRQNLGIQTFLGADGIKTAYEKTLGAKELDIICLAGDYQSVIGNYFEEYARKLYSSTTKTREILPDNQENRDYAAKKDSKKNQVRFLKVLTPSESDLMLFDNQAVLVSYNKTAPFALVITDENLVASFQNQFGALWGQLPA